MNAPIQPEPALLPGSSALRVANVLLRRRKLLLLLSLLFGLAGLAHALLRTPGYQATSDFVPQATQKDLSQFTGIAAQLGIALPGGGNAGDSPEFYAGLLRSRELLMEAASVRYAVPGAGAGADSVRGTLAQLLRVGGRTPDERSRLLLDRLLRDVDANVDVKTGMITVTTRAPWPGLAVAVNRRLLDLVNEFNLDRRRFQARAEREFVQGRMNELRRELATAEQRVTDFEASNRSFQSSPMLALQHSRLVRAADLIQQVYTSVVQSYERARIDEVRNTPVVTIIDPPEGSARPVPRKALLRALVVALLGLMVGVLLAFLQEYLERQRQDAPEEYAEFDSHLGLLGVVLRGRRVGQNGHGQPSALAPLPGGGGRLEN